METPYLQLNKSRLVNNLDRMQASANRKQVRLRPHLKTAKSIDVADMALKRGAEGVTVSTLLEAEYFADQGVKDIIYAVGMTPDKLGRVGRLIHRGIDLKIITDNLVVAEAIAECSREQNMRLPTLIELDCGDHRAGLSDQDEALISVAQKLNEADCYEGVLTHAGHSYGVSGAEEIAKIAHLEAECARQAVGRLAEAGIVSEIVSVGSTPTALADVDLTDVTEMRAGVYVFYDIDQYSRGVCDFQDLALMVVASVIGHNRQAGKILLDAGGLALSKDRSADHFAPDAGYGFLCDPRTGERLGNLAVNAVSQEHGHVSISDEEDYLKLPIGSKVGVFPIHACMTAAAYDQYHLLGSDEVWKRVNGW